MENESIISLINISKRYKIYSKPRDKLKEVLWSVFSKEKQYHRDFWALRDINLDIPKGTTFGIIGRNGSGKSTLLQIISGILHPTSGSVNVKGRVSALLELGAGFNREFSGRENVFMQGAIMGISREEMKKRFDAIADFADIGEFIEQPVKTYSSGMYVRLAFATAINVDPDLLIVDEVLAVGDFKFRQKCFERITEIQKRASVILVSHSMRDILMLCSEVLLLNNGCSVFQGDVEEAIDYYMKLSEEEEKKRADKKTFEAIANNEARTIESAICGDMLHNEEKITDVRHKWVDKSGNTVRSINHGSQIVLKFSFKIIAPVNNLIIGVPIWDSKGNMMTAFNTDMNRIKITIEKDGYVKGRLDIEHMGFNPGMYYTVFVVHDGKEYLYRQIVDTFRVKDVPIYFGIVTLDHRWTFNDEQVYQSVTNG